MKKFRIFTYPFLVIELVVVLILGCGTSAENQSESFEFHFKIASEYRGCYGTAYVMKDKETEKEYIVISNERGVAITPRLQKD